MFYHVLQGLVLLTFCLALLPLHYAAVLIQKQYVLQLTDTDKVKNDLKNSLQEPAFMSSRYHLR